MVRVQLPAIIALFALSSCGHLVPAHHQSIDPLDLPKGQFELDPAHASLIWKIDHLGFSTYVGRFNSFDAKLDFDPKDPTGSKLSVTVDLSSVDTGDPAFDQELKGSTWLNADQHPTARFQSQAVAVTGTDTGTALGILDLNDRERPVTLDIIFNGGANNILTSRYTLGFSASAKLQRSEFGIDYLAPAIGETVILEIHAEFVEVPGS